MDIMQIIQKYEALTYEKRLALLEEKDNATQEISSSEEKIEHFIIFMVAIAHCNTSAQIEEVEEYDKWDESNTGYRIAEEYIRSDESWKTLKKEDRYILIGWIESHVVDKHYGREYSDSFEDDYSHTMTWLRYWLINTLFVYSPEQLEKLRKVNDFFIEAGTQLYHKAKSLETMMDEEEENPDFSYTLQTAYTCHEATPYEHWLSKQFQTDIGMQWNGGKIGEVPESFTYLSSDLDHWDEGLDREKVKDINLCYLYHDLWDHQYLPYSVMDIIRIKEIKAVIKISLDYNEEESVWND